MMDIFMALVAPTNLFILSLGVLVGIVIGALPGLNVVFALAALLPISLSLDSVSGVLLLLGSYCGSTFGGSITAILINTPGTAASAASTLDGYAMAKQGKAGDAIKIALISSTLGGVISCIALVFFAPVLAKVATAFSTEELFALAIFGICAVVGIAGDDVIGGLIMAAIGLLISVVGIDPAEGVARLTFGSNDLLSGLSAVVVMLGLYAMTEVFVQACLKDAPKKEDDEEVVFQKATIKFMDIVKYYKTIIVSSLIGIFIGAVPGTGGGVSSWLSYNEAKRTSKEPDMFMKGSVEGLISAETGKNATTGATLIPLLTLGIPGDAATAVLLGALTMHKIVPGSSLFASGSTWVMGGLLLINLAMWLLGTVMAPLFANITKVPERILYPCITFLTVAGAFAISNTTFNVTILIVFGIFGFFCRMYKFPIAPMVIGTILGPIIEINLRRSLIFADGSYSTFFTRPISLFILMMSLFSLLYPFLVKYMKKKSRERLALKKENEN